MSFPSKDNIAAVINARGGSKRLVRKNMQLVGGIPLLEHNLIAATQAEHISSVFFCSEDEEMKDLARSYNVHIIDRPWQISDDTATGTAVYLYSMSEACKFGDFNYVATLYPSSPLVSAFDIDDCIEQFRKNPFALSTGCVMLVEKPGSYFNHVLLKDERGMIVSLWGPQNTTPIPPAVAQLILYKSGGGFSISQVNHIRKAKLKRPTPKMSMDEVNAYYQANNDLTFDEKLPSNMASTMAYITNEITCTDVNKPKDLIVARALYEFRQKEYETVGGD